ncbi:MAG: hypothetical protein ACRC1H_18915, partial [Caldilineaceae bacterium]
MAGLLDNYLDPAAASQAGLFEGLTRFGAALAEAGRPRLVAREGFGPGLLGGLASGFGGFGAGMREGRQNALTQQLQTRQVTEGLRADQAYNNLQSSGAVPEHLRSLLPAMDRNTAMTLLGRAALEREQAGQARSFIAGMGGGAAPQPPAMVAATPNGAPGVAPPPPDLLPFFEEASRETGIPVPILVAQARQESNF